MAINEALVRGVHAAVRAYFKGKTKSSNKVYNADVIDMKSSPAMQEKVTLRNMNAMGALSLIKDLRRDRKFKSDDILPFGFDVLDQGNVVGNCTEMAAAAAYLVRRENMGTAWFVGINPPGDHAFCLVDNGVDHHPATIGGAKGYSVCSADSWVIDPWANVCCKMRDYEATFSQKMREWSRQGKRVIIEREGDDYASAIDPAGNEWLSGFRKGPTHYVKSSDQLPQGIPKALYRVLPQDFRKVKKNGGCVIL